MFFINQAIASEVVENVAANPNIAQPAASGFVPILLIFVIFYFFLIRPQQKKMKEHKSMTNSLAKNDTVLTAGGLLGKVVKVNKDDFIDVQIAEKTIVQVLRSTISSKIDQKVDFVEEVKTKEKAKPVKKAASTKANKTKQAKPAK